MKADLEQFASKDVCYLTTIGRISGRPHRIEIWFALNGHTLYMLSGGGVENTDWVKNVLRLPDVIVEIQDTVFDGKARLVEDREENALARQLIGEKYQESEPDLDEWLRSSLPVAVDLVV